MIVEIDAVYGRDEPERVVMLYDAYLRVSWQAYVEYSVPRPLGATWAYCFTNLVCEIPYYDWQVPWPDEQPWRTQPWRTSRGVAGGRPGTLYMS